MAIRLNVFINSTSAFRFEEIDVPDWKHQCINNDHLQIRSRQFGKYRYANRIQTQIVISVESTFYDFRSNEILKILKMTISYHEMD